MFTPKEAETRPMSPEIPRLSEQIHRVLVQPVHSSGSQGGQGSQGAPACSSHGSQGGQGSQQPRRRRHDPDDDDSNSHCKRDTHTHRPVSSPDRGAGGVRDGDDPGPCEMSPCYRLALIS